VGLTAQLRSCERWGRAGRARPDPALRNADVTVERDFLDA